MGLFRYLMRRHHKKMRAAMMRKYNRHVSFGDMVADRWETARFMGFGQGTSVYDNVLIIGDVRIGENCWVGPGCLLDGSGGLAIGDFCSISAGVQIYTHNSVQWATSMGAQAIERKSTTIGSGVYVGPNAVIQMGVTIGDRAVIGAMSYVNRDIPAGARAMGAPVRINS